jgi:hypothetical protein
VDPLGGLPGVFGGKLWVSVFAGTRGEKVLETPGREYKAEERKRLRGVEVTPEKLVDFETFAGAGADATTDEDTT